MSGQLCKTYAGNTTIIIIIIIIIITVNSENAVNIVNSPLIT